jgi:hypothetical protein
MQGEQNDLRFRRQVLTDYGTQNPHNPQTSGVLSRDVVVSPIGKLGRRWCTVPCLAGGTGTVCCAD